MKYTVKPSVFAKTDKKEIIKHLDQYSTTAPTRFRQALKKYLDIISDNPHIFSVYQASPAYRHVVVYDSYVIFYSIDEQTKIVLLHRILHGAQDIENVL